MTQVQRLMKIQAQLDKLVEKQTKPVWVRVGFIQELTGWGRQALRRAREQALVNFEEREDGIWYDANSIPEIFIKKHN